MSAVIVLFVLAGSLLAFGLHGVWRGMSARNWPSAAGRMVEAAVIEQQVVSRIRHSLFVPHVRFEYEAIGRSYSSTRVSTIALDHSSSDRESVEAFLLAYAPGMAVVVRVNPEEPSFAVRRHRASFKAIERYLAWALAGVLVLVIAWVVAQLHNAP